MLRELLDWNCNDVCFKCRAIMANMIRLWNWTRKVHLGVMESVCVYICSCVKASHKREQISYKLWPKVQRFWALNWFRAPMRIDRINRKHGRNALLACRIGLLEKPNDTMLTARWAGSISPSAITLQPHRPLKADASNFPNSRKMSVIKQIQTICQFWTKHIWQIVLALLAKTLKYCIRLKCLL